VLWSIKAGFSQAGISLLFLISPTADPNIISVYQEPDKQWPQKSAWKRELRIWLHIP